MQQIIENVLLPSAKDIISLLKFFLLQGFIYCILLYIVFAPTRENEFCLIAMLKFDGIVIEYRLIRGARWGISC